MSQELFDFFGNAWVRLILGGAGLAMLVVIGVYVVGLARGQLHQERPSSSDLLTNFRELHSKGELADEEFRTIKGTLGTRLKEELKRDEEDG